MVTKGNYSHSTVLIGHERPGESKANTSKYFMRAASFDSANQFAVSNNISMNINNNNTSLQSVAFSQKEGCVEGGISCVHHSEMHPTYHPKSSALWCRTALYGTSFSCPFHSQQLVAGLFHRHATNGAVECLTLVPVTTVEMQRHKLFNLGATPFLSAARAKHRRLLVSTAEHETGNLWLPAASASFRVTPTCTLGTVPQAPTVAEFGFILAGSRG